MWGFKFMVRDLPYSFRNVNTVHHSTRADPRQSSDRGDVNTKGLLYTGMQELQIDQTIMGDVVVVLKGSPDFFHKCCVSFRRLQEEKDDGVQGNLDRVVSGNEELQRYLLQMDLLLLGARGRGIRRKHIVDEIRMLRIPSVVNAFLYLLAVDLQDLG